MELWAGFECTRNRVGDTYREQLDRAEEGLRRDVLGQLGALGVKAFRYRIAWDDPDTPARTIEQDLAVLRAQGIRPVAGLLHHGSGPPHVDLLSPGFAEGLAAHARDVANRFPDIEDWTPVNEPLTTARFSALYGFWYPHRTSEAEFWLALINQIDGTRLAMREILSINPAARLVQTEDLGRTYATAALGDQAAFDNQRRWMTWDLLEGRVVPGHPLHARLSGMGFRERLDAIARDPCPADIIGVNHYVTSDRFLDHRLARYPAAKHGGNGRRAYADVEAVRVLSTPYGGIADALREAAERYRKPVALTECHIGCTREEQMRWIVEAWAGARALAKEGHDIRAITAWALTGTRDWSGLSTGACDDFECGAFDLRGGTAQPTAIAETLAAVAKGRPAAPVAAGAGWWRRPARLSYPHAGVARPVDPYSPAAPGEPLLIAGATGTLGQALQRAARARGIFTILTSRDEMALDDPKSVATALTRYRPWGVVNATGWVRVDEAEAAMEDCWRVNVTGAINLAIACEARALPHAHFSSDLVFGDSGEAPFDERHSTAPLSVYGESKAEADRVLSVMPHALIVRTAAFFSPHDRYNFAHAVVETLRAGSDFAASPDHRVSPTYVPHLADCVLDLLIDRASGLWHVAGDEEMSWRDFARRTAAACGFDPHRIGDATPQSLGWAAARPVRAGLVSQQGRRLPPFEHALADFAQTVAARA